MTGGTVSTMAMDWLHIVELPQQSVACQVRVTMPGQTLRELVTVLTTTTTMLAGAQQASVTVGGVKIKGAPQEMVVLGAQVITGGVVSSSTTRWLQTGELFVQQSVAIQ